MKEFELLQAVDKVDTEVLERTWNLCISLMSIKSCQQGIKNVMAKGSRFKLSAGDIEGLARLLSVFVSLTNHDKEE